MRNSHNFRQAVESPKSWNSMGFFCPKNTLFQLKHIYRGFIYLTLNYLFTKFPNFLSHFWNHKSFFLKQLLCISLGQTWHTFDKSSPSKCKCSDFPLLTLKLTKSLVSFFKQNVNFLSKFESFFSAMTHDSSVLSWLKHNVLSTKVAHQSEDFQTCHSSH